MRVSTLSTIGSLAEARWNLAAKASFRLTGRRGAVGTGARFAHSRKNYLKKKSLNCMHKALALTIAKISYSQLSDKSTGTMEKKPTKISCGTHFSCSTIGMNSIFLLAVLLFQRYYRANFGRFKWEINRNEHYLLWKWYIKVSLMHIN